MLLGAGLILTLYLIAQVLLLLYSSHRYVTLVRWWRARRAAPRAMPAVPQAGEWPVVTVQLPLYNEPAVARRLIDAVAGLDYPRDRLEIQVLDDSTDGTTDIAREAAAEHRHSGLDVAVHHRDRRQGFKAGALATGLARARGSLIAVFDADFVPPRDFLTKLVPHLVDPRVGMVQARWEHLNRERSALTQAQAVMLDAHFMLEHEARMASGLFFNFNGTAGVWRRACVEDAGGWSAETLTEDLDLSYRAQLRGWRFVYVPSVACPAELPGDIEALKSQQRRWTQGAIQTACRILPKLWRGDWPLRVKVEALFHLTSNLSYPLVLALAALMLPVMMTASPRESWFGAWLHAGVLGFGVLPVVLFLAAGQFALAPPNPWRLLGGVLGALVLGVGLSVNNAIAALHGFTGNSSRWERTPKTGDAMRLPAPRRPRVVPGHAGVLEMALAVYCVVLAIEALRSGHDRALPFLALLVTGFVAVGWASRGVGPDPAAMATTRDARGA